MKHNTIKIGIFLLLALNVFSINPYIRSVRGFDGTLWNFSNTIFSSYYYDSDFTYSQSINIYSGGKLHLANLTMTLDANVTFYLYTGATLIIENCKIVAGNYDPAYYSKMAIRAQTGTNLTIVDSTLECIGKTADDFTYTFDSRSIWLETNIARIEGNIFKNGEYEMCFITLNGNKSADTIIRNNRFISTTNNRAYYSFYLENCKQTPNLFNNTFYEELGYYLTGSDNIVINNNSFYFSSATNYEKAINAFTCQNITIINNTFTGYNYGTYLNLVHYSRIENNIYTSPSYSIQADACNYDLFKNNRFIQSGSGNSFELLSFSSILGCNFTGNKFNLTQRFGTKFRPIAFDQYSIDNSYLKFEPTNKVNDKPMLFYEDIQSDLDFGGVELGALYLVNCSQMAITNILMSDSYGIEGIANNNHLTFENVTVLKSFSTGFFMTDATNITINNSRFEKCGYAGIFLEDSDEYILERNLVNNNFFGILSDFYNYDMIFRFNTISNNGNPAIYNQNNTFLTGAGLFVRYAYNVSVKNNFFYRNWYTGYVLGVDAYSYIEQSKCESNNFSQYINILGQKYSRSAIDNSQTSLGCSWVGNTFSENPTYNQNYLIPGSAQSVDSSQAYIDSDGDGASDVTELSWGSSSATDQTDNDSISDWTEIFTYKSNPNASDTDGDLLTDDLEIQNGTSLLLSDTDEDGFTDYIEHLYGTSGIDKNSYPGKKQTEVPTSDSNYNEPEDLKNIIPGYPMGWMILVFAATIFVLILKKKKTFNLQQGGFTNAQ